MNTAVRIERYLEVSPRTGLGETIDAIFFEASATQSFESPGERAAFRERWLGRYLSEYPHFAYLAVDAGDAVVGYLVGSPEPPPPETNPFENFRDLTRRFPAHLHVNTAHRCRNKGYGGKLIDVFVADLRKAEVLGVHVVTTADSKNVRFYNRNRFMEVARLSGPPALVFLARNL
jgi:ribosomal protein S18 acetylase RimI-like enzyme